jgi:hypothetical protein
MFQLPQYSRNVFWPRHAEYLCFPTLLKINAISTGALTYWSLKRQPSVFTVRKELNFM